jgi:hypothetical protein
VDWAERHLRDGESVVADLGWAVSPQIGTQDELIATGHSMMGSVGQVRLTAGIAGALYVITGQVQTSLNRVISHSVAVRVAAEV